MNWNGWENTLECLDYLGKCIDYVHSIIIVDNGSTDSSLEKIRGYINEIAKVKDSAIDLFYKGIKVDIFSYEGIVPITVIALNQNLGGSGGRNIGIDWALEDRTAEYIFFLDNDARIELETLSSCLQLANKHRFEVIGCLVKNYDSSVQFDGLKFIPNIFYIDILFALKFFKYSMDYWEVDEVTSCGMMVSRGILEKLKIRRGYYFDPQFFHWSEDQKFCLTAKREGAKIVIARKAVIYHKISRGGAGVHAAYYYSARNRLFLANEFLPIGLKILFHAYYPSYRLIRSFFELCRGNISIARAHIEGLVDGYKGVGGKWKKQNQ